jgi:signal transduction histidine kinase/ActR/RegA family two-component response regulator
LAIVAIVQYFVALGISLFVPVENGFLRAGIEILSLTLIAIPLIVWRCINRILNIQSSILEHDKSEQSIQRLNQMQNEMGRIARVGGWEFEPATGFVTWTKEMYEIFEVPTSYTPELATSLACFPGEGSKIVAEHIKHAAETGKGFEYTLPFITAKGRNIWIHGIGKVERRSDGTVRLYGAFQDVTESQQRNVELTKARDSAESASRAKTEFLANMSHEIRTPLTAIIGFADILHDDQHLILSHERRIEMIDTIRNAGQHLLSVINNILDLTKIEEGKMTINLTVTQVDEILNDVQSLIRPKAADKGISLDIILQTSIPDRIISEPTYLRKILMNLATNAIKFTDHGSVTIQVRTVERENLARLVFDFVDTGVGMTPTQAHMVFDPFTQADSGMARKNGGTGLGLTISRRLAKLIGGNVTLEQSVLNQGSVFRLELPLEVVGGSGVIKSNERSLQRVSPVLKNDVKLNGRILLAEDGPDNQRLISFHLKRAGAEVDVAENGKIALEMHDRAHANGRPYDLLLSDMQMPEIDGYTLVKMLREKGCEMPIIALTAHALSEDRNKCIAAGCNDFAMKPIDRKTLLELCNAYLGNLAANPHVNN